MFDFAWTEIALIAVVALVAIGPKDMPIAIRGVTNAIKKARRMAAEFQTHVDEMVREANLDEVRSQFNDIRRMDLKSQVLKHVDPDGGIRGAMSGPFAASPMSKASSVSMPGPEAETIVAERPPAEAEPAILPPVTRQPLADRGPAPAFVPPRFAAPPERPAFVPPNVPMPKA